MGANGRKPEPVDVVIVGVGATGGTAARVLAEAGLKVVGLERGPWLRPEERFSGAEIKFVNRNYFWQDARLTPRTVREDRERPERALPLLAQVRRWSAAARCTGPVGCHARCRRISASAPSTGTSTAIARRRQIWYRLSVARASARSSGSSGARASTAPTSSPHRAARGIPARRLPRHSSAGSSTKAARSSGSMPSRCRTPWSRRRTRGATRPTGRDSGTSTATRPRRTRARSLTSLVPRGGRNQELELRPNYS